MSFVLRSYFVFILAALGLCWALYKGFVKKDWNSAKEIISLSLFFRRRLLLAFLFYLAPVRSQRPRIFQKAIIYCTFNKKFIMYRIGLFVLALLCAGFVKAQTPIGGVFSTNTTLTLANSPYEVTNNVLVPQGVTVTVDPGVVISFDPGKYWQVEGEFKALGTLSMPILFTADTGAGGWAGFRIMDTSVDYDSISGSGTIFSYCIIENEGQWLINSVDDSFIFYIDQTSPLISDCKIRHFYSGINMDRSSTHLLRNKIYNGLYLPLSVFNYGLPYAPYIYGNEWYNNNGGSNPSITLWGGAIFRANCIHDIGDALVLRVTSNLVTIDSNSIMNCPNVAIGIFGGNDTTLRITNNILSGNRINLVLSACQRYPVIRGNNFMNYTDYQVYASTYYYPFSNYDCNSISGSYSMNMNGNYWGTTNSSQIAGSVWDYYDDFSVGVIADYSSFANTPYPLPSPVGCDLLISTPEMQAAAGVKLYPNPAADKITFSFSKNLVGYISVYDANGRECLRMPVCNSSEVSADLGAFAPGLYMYRLNAPNDSSCSGRFVVTR